MVNDRSTGIERIGASLPLVQEVARSTEGFTSLSDEAQAETTAFASFFLEFVRDPSPINQGQLLSTLAEIEGSNGDVKLAVVVGLRVIAKDRQGSGLVGTRMDDSSGDYPDWLEQREDI